MSTKETLLKKPIEGTDPEDLGVFGIDTEGDRHRYDAQKHLLVVTDEDGDPIHSRDMTPKELLKGWIPHIAAERGWIDQWADEEDVGLLDAQTRLSDATRAAREGE